MGVADWSLEDVGTTQLIGLIDFHMKPKTGKPSPSAARTRLQAISNLYEWCVERELAAANPVHWLPKKRKPTPPPSREYVIPMRDLRKIWESADALGEPLRSYVLLWLLLPLRRAELAHLQWSDIDLEDGRIRLSGSATKNREPFQIPLSAAACRILEARKEAATSELVFPSNRKPDVPIEGYGKYKEKVQDVSGTDKWTWHDTRRAFVSHLAELGFDIDLVDGLLNHAQAGTRGGVLGTYQRSARWPEKVRAMEAWAGAVTGEDQGQVIELRAGK
jgi:integrase